MTEKQKGLYHYSPQSYTYKEEVNVNESQCKGSTPSKKIGKVFDLLSTGGKFTAREINRICDTNDARKCISELSHHWGVNIGREWHKDGYKLFWIEPERKEVVL